MNSHMYVVDRANTVRMQVEDQKGDEYRSWREVTIWIDSGFSEQETIFKSTFKTNWSDKFLRMVLPTLGRILSRLVVQGGEIMEWQEKERMIDGKGVYYESVTTAGRRAWVIQRDRDFPLWEASIDTRFGVPSLDMHVDIRCGPSYLVKTAAESMRLCERMVQELGI